MSKITFTLNCARFSEDLTPSFIVFSESNSEKSTSMSSTKLWRHAKSSSKRSQTVINTYLRPVEVVLETFRSPK